MAATGARRKQLMDRLKELDLRLHDIVDALEEPASQDWGDAATERESVEVLESLGDSGKREIAAIRAALQRIADGSYGVCVVCDEAIAEERLDLLPATPFCSRCAP